MKNITAMLVTFLFTVTSALSFEVNWKSSCGSDFSNPENGTYIFTVKKGEVGGCPSDSNKQRHASTAWKFSERAEAVSYTHLTLPTIYSV